MTNEERATNDAIFLLARLAGEEAGKAASTDDPHGSPLLRDLPYEVLYPQAATLLIALTSNPDVTNRRYQQRFADAMRSTHSQRVQRRHPESITS